MSRTGSRRNLDLLRRPSGAAPAGGGFDPTQVTSADLRAYWILDGTETVVSGEVTTVPDQTANGNDLVVPSITGITGPTYEAEGWAGLPSMLFNGVDMGLIRSTFDFNAVRGSYTLFLLCQAIGTSGRFMGFQSDRPFFSARTEGFFWTADGAITDAVDDSIFGRSLVVGRFDEPNDFQDAWVDGVKASGPTASTEPGSDLDGGSIGLGYNGHPTTFGSPCNIRIRAAGVFQGFVADEEM